MFIFVFPPTWRPNTQFVMCDVTRKWSIAPKVSEEPIEPIETIVPEEPIEPTVPILAIEPIECFHSVPWD